MHLIAKPWETSSLPASPVSLVPLHSAHLSLGSSHTGLFALHQHTAPVVLHDIAAAVPSTRNTLPQNPHTAHSISSFRSQLKCQRLKDFSTTSSWSSCPSPPPQTHTPAQALNHVLTQEKVSSSGQELLTSCSSL